MQNFHTSQVMITITATPPTTPPAIAPVTGAPPLLEELGLADGLLPPIFVHSVLAHSSQDAVINEQLSSGAQAGHGGLSDSH